jgi:hypothetical protein
MNLLSQVSKGKIKKPHRILVFGPDGVGKSTFGADAPNPIFIGSEDGTANLDVHRFPKPNSFSEVLQMVSELANTEHKYKTLVIDSLDWLEPLVWQHVCASHKKASIEEVGGGYGKGYVEAQDEWRKLINSVQSLQDQKKMNLICIAHSQVKAFVDPTKNATYDRYILKLNEKAAALWREFVDSVLFANFEVFVKNADDRKAKAYGDGARFIFTERRPAFDAKNRAALPFQLPLSWESYQSATETGGDAVKIRENIVTLVSELKDEEIKKRVMEATEAATNDPDKLAKILNKLQSILEAK